MLNYLFPLASLFKYTLTAKVAKIIMTTFIFVSYLYCRKKPSSAETNPIGQLGQDRSSILF
jgi:hypothetical protein